MQNLNIIVNGQWVCIRDNNRLITHAGRVLSFRDWDTVEIDTSRPEIGEEVSIAARPSRPRAAEPALNLVITVNDSCGRLSSDDRDKLIARRIVQAGLQELQNQNAFKRPSLFSRLLYRIRFWHRG